ncbi:hypothetical protein MRY82_06610, partial [bacterium]|nr:hypothetical protein [bacterium]
EWALRLYRQIKAHSVALYYYNGFWKSPSGFSLANQKYTFPKLSVYGASYRGPVFKGIFNAEAGYYQSHDDAQGNNPLLRNGEWRGLLGYEREVKANLKVSLQYYMEYMEDHANYVANNPAPNAQNAVRHMLTLRMTQLLMQQNLMISIFNFYGVNEQDGFLKASANYKLDDHWQAELGGNVFYGKDEFTFFGQFEDASNVYASIRYNF